MDVLQQAGKAIGQGDAERRQQVVPVWLHVLAGPALGVALAARVLVVGGHNVGDEVVVAAGGLWARTRTFMADKKSDPGCKKGGGNVARSMCDESGISG